VLTEILGLEDVFRLAEIERVYRMVALLMHIEERGGSIPEIDKMATTLRLRVFSFAEVPSAGVYTPRI
jgi:hypothetical protein